ncbi:MAG TPA: hypothetical protein VMF56_02540 [Acidobacteriaceae bacterium]|nr:hypothetical protein [Acidobacteriaceae bacterium]
MVEFGEKMQDSEKDGFDPELEAMFEQELRATLQAGPAPDGFADRVLARVDALPRHEPLSWPLRAIRNPVVRGAIAAALLLSVGVGGYFEHKRERQIAGEHARQQVLLALRITSSTLQDVRSKVDGDTTNQQDAN